MRFVIIEINDGGATAYVNSKDELIARLSMTSAWAAAKTRADGLLWEVGDVLGFPCGWIFCVRDCITQDHLDYPET